MATKTFIAGGTDNNWGTANNWSPVASVPANGDDVILNASSPNCIVNVNSNNLNSFNMTGYTHTLSGASNISVMGSAGTTQTCLFAGTITWTGTLNLYASSATSQLNVTSGGMSTCGGIVISAVVAGAPVYFLDAINLAATKTFNLVMGAAHLDGLTDNAGLTHSMGLLAANNANTRSLNLGNSTINLSGTGTVLNLSTQTGLTITPGGSTVNITDTGSSSKTLDFGATVVLTTARAFNNLSITGGGTGAVILTNGTSNTTVFNNFTVGAPKTVTFTAGKNFTINGIFSAVGTSANGITLGSSTTSNATLVFGGSATFTTDYVTSSYLTASGTLPYQWGGNSTMGSSDIGFSLISYNTTLGNPLQIYQATAGGTVFGANQAANAAFTYFSNTPSVNDAIYFSGALSNRAFSNLKLQIGTAMAGTGIVLAFEYLTQANTWAALYQMTDGSNGLTTLGAVTIKFPVQPNANGKEAAAIVNGISTYAWVRIRLVSFTTVTNGGANATTKPLVGDGGLSCYGFTTSYPCTFAKLYSWALSNCPEIEPSNPINGVYRFNNCIINLASTTQTLNEQIYIGNGASTTYILDASYLISGGPSGADGWVNSSDFFFCCNQYSAVINTSASTLVYGGSWNLFNNIVNGAARTGSAYLSTALGTYIGLEVRDQAGYFSGAVVANKMTITGGLVCSTLPNTYPNNTRISNQSSQIWILYGTANGPIENVNYVMPSVSVFTITQYDPDVIWYADNLSPVLPDIGSAVAPINRSSGIGTFTALTKAFYYTSIGASYTDYTTQINSATANDVPLPNAVGDCLYINWAANTLQVASLFATVPSQANDNTYVWEWYAGSGVWTSCANVWDLSYNFTVTGRIFPQTTALWATALINGVTALWLRLRCTSQGTTSPVLSTLSWRSDAGAGLWRLYERYTTNINVKSGGTAVAGALVSILDATLTPLAGSPFTTDSSGNIPAQTIPKRFFFFDPINVPLETVYNINQVLYNPWTYIVSMYGYLTQTIPKTVSQASSDGISLTVNPYLVANYATAGAITGIAINGVAKTITITQPVTVQQLYDYSQWWRNQSTNLGYGDPVSPLSSTNFSLSYGWVCNLTGGSLKDTSKVFGGTLAITASGYFEDITGAIWDASGVLYSASAVSLTFKDGATAKQFVECYAYESGGLNLTYNSSRAAVTTLTSNSSGVVSGYIVYKIGATTYTGHTLKARLYGYNTYSVPKTVNGAALSSIEQLVLDSLCTDSRATVAALAGLSLNYSTQALAITSVLTIAQFYEVIKYTDALATNLVNADTITSIDGVNYTLFTNWSTTITGGQLTDLGKQIVYQGTGTLTVASSGYYEDKVGAIWDVAGVTYKASAVSHTILAGTTPIVGANIAYYNGSVNLTANAVRSLVATLATNSSGIASGYAVWKIGTALYANQNLYTKSYGYQRSNIPQTLNGSPIVDSLQSTADAYTLATPTAAALITGITIDGVAKTITVIGTRTLQELYDYTQYWASLSANLVYGEPLSTTDGTNYALATSWALLVTGGSLKDVSKVITGTITVSSAGYYEDKSGAVWDVSGTLYYASAISFTFKDGATTKQFVECYVSESGGLNLTYNTVRSNVPTLTSDSSGNVRGYLVYQIGATSYTGHTLKARLYGYTTYSVPKTVNGAAIVSTEQLSVDVLCVDSASTVAALTGITLDYTAKTVTVSSIKNILSLYEYIKYSDSLATSLVNIDTINSPDDVNFLFASNWGINVAGGQLTDVAKQIVYQGTGALTVSSSGYYEDVLGATWDVSGVTYKASAVSHIVQQGSTLLVGVGLAYFSGSVNLTYDSSRTLVQGLTTDSVGHCSGYAVYKIGATLYTGQNLISKKYGFKKSSIPKTVSGTKITDGIQLTADGYVSRAYTAAGALTGISIVGNTSLAVISANYLQDVYDYSQWWSAQLANLLYNEPLSLTDGTNVSIDSSYVVSPVNYITVDSKVLTGGAITFSTAGSYALHLGTTDLVFTAASGVYDLRGSIILGTVTLINTGGGFLNVKLPYGTSVVTSGPNITIELSKLVTVSIPNLVAGTRVQLYDLDNSVELDNSVVSGTGGYSYTHTYTGDKNIRVKACYQVGTAANYPIDEVGIISISGLTLLTTQVVDPFYAAIGIDGSVVDSANGGEITANYAHIEINISSTLGVMDARRAISWWRYITQTTAGISNYDPGALTYAPDEYNIVIDGPLLIANVNSAALTIVNGVWVRADGISIIDPTSNTIIWVPDGRVYTASDSRASLTAIKNNTNLIPALL